MATMNFKLHNCCGRYKSMSLSVIVTIWIPLPLRGIGISDMTSSIHCCCVNEPTATALLSTPMNSIRELLTA